MDEKKVQEIFSDEAFVTSLLAMDTAEEVQTAVKVKGLDLSISDIESLKARLNSEKMGELSANDLTQVSGGLSRETEDKIVDIIVGCVTVMAFCVNSLPVVRW